MGLSGLFYDPMFFLLQVLYNIPGVIIAFTIHEFMHAAVATLCGDSLPGRDGRLTLNPGAHIDPVGFLMLLIFRFGWAKPVMVNPTNFKNRRRDDILVSIAGPLSNLVLAIVLFPLTIFVQHPSISPFISAAYSINVLLFFLNMLPIPPLDGFRVVKSLMNPSSYVKIWQLERYGFLILIVLSFTGILGVFLGYASMYTNLLFMRVLMFFV